MIVNPILPIYILYIALAAIAGAIVYCICKKPLRKAKNFRRLAILALIVFAMLRPGLANGSADRSLSNLNIFFVIDDTGSMAAKDMNNNSSYRYEVMAEDMEKIIGLFPGAKYAIISLDYNAYQAMPLVDDADTALSYVHSLMPKESISSADSDLSSLLSLADQRIAKYAERAEQHKDTYGHRDSLLFFMSDGENANDASIKVPETLAQNIIGGAVIGYGSIAGTHIGEISTNYKTRKVEISDTSFIKDPKTGIEHISRLNETNLSNVSDTLGIQYYRRANSGDKFDKTSNFVSETAIYHRSDSKTNASNDFYWLFVLIAVILLLWDFYGIIESILLERKVAK